jgi:outer membrane murein-binding lipoprotein Lpp
MRLLIAASLLGGLLLGGCGSEECQAHGENCSQSFKMSQYGRTDIQCCSGTTCQEGVISGALVCE